MNPSQTIYKRLNELDECDPCPQKEQNVWTTNNMGVASITFVVQIMKFNFYVINLIKFLVNICCSFFAKSSKFFHFNL